jgi:hypothetical protein
MSHLISQCHIDILQLIFEEAVRPNREGQKMAISISHVCRRWRYTALQTPRLWTYLECGEPDDHDGMESYWNSMHERSKGLPVVIALYDVKYPRIQYADSYALDRFSNIRRLSFHSDDIMDLFSRVTESPSVYGGNLDELELIFQDDIHNDGYVGKILDIFPPIRRLMLYKISSFTLGESPQFSHIRHFVLKDMGFMGPFGVLGAFPQLEELELTMVHVLLFTQINSSVSLNSLKRLKVRKTEDVLSWLTCPNLVILDVDDYIRQYAIISFISRHSSITNLLSTDWKNINQLHTAAPQLKHLTFSYASVTSYWPVLMDYRTITPLPSLQSLTVRDMRKTMGLAQFEMLVRARCLPHQHSQSLIPPTIEPLRRLVLQIPLDALPENAYWGTSEWYSTANCTLQRDEDEQFRLVTLSWI